MKLHLTHTRYPGVNAAHVAALQGCAAADRSRLDNKVLAINNVFFEWFVVSYFFSSVPLSCFIEKISTITALSTLSTITASLEYLDLDHVSLVKTESFRFLSVILDNHY